MLSKQKSCYSIHRDFTPRLHLPIVTNQDCYFLSESPLKMFHLPADGTTTFIDTRSNHTFLNTSEHSRLHIVMNVNINRETLQHLI